MKSLMILVWHKFWCKFYFVTRVPQHEMSRTRSVSLVVLKDMWGVGRRRLVSEALYYAFEFRLLLFNFTNFCFGS